MMSDKEYMLFKDHIGARPQEWVTVSRMTSQCGKNRRFVFSALASKESADRLLKTPEHEVNPRRFGIPTFLETDEGVKFDPSDSYDEDGVHLEPFVLWMDFHGVRPDTYEIIQGFVAYHGLFFDQEKNAYVDLEGGEVVRVLPSCVQVSEEALHDYLAARDMVLVLYYDHDRRLDISVAKVFGKERVDRVPKVKDANYVQVIINLEDGSAYSRLLGKRIVRPDTEPLHRDYVDAFDRPQDYATYRCRVDGKRVERSCDVESGRQPGPFLTPVFFKREVLSKYHKSGLYEVRNGTVWHLDLWYIEFGDRGDVIHVWLGDLGRIPYEEQEYWKRYNVVLRDLEKNFARRQLLGEFTENMSGCEILLDLRSKINTNFERRFGFKLFGKTPAGENAIELHDLAYNEESEFNEQVLNMAKIFVDGINVKGLESNAEEKNVGSIQPLEEFLIRSKLEPGAAKKIAGAFRMVQNMRSAGAAHPRGEKYEEQKRRFGLEDKDPKNRFGKIVKGFGGQLVALNTWLERGQDPPD